MCASVVIKYRLQLYLPNRCYLHNPLWVLFVPAVTRTEEEDKTLPFKSRMISANPNQEHNIHNGSQKMIYWSGCFKQSVAVLCERELHMSVETSEYQIISHVRVEQRSCFLKGKTFHRRGRSFIQIFLQDESVKNIEFCNREPRNLQMINIWRILGSVTMRHISYYSD